MSQSSFSPSAVRPAARTLMQRWRTALQVAGLSAAFAGAVVSTTALAAVNIPDIPLGVINTARPMVMLVASRDHKLFYEAYNDASDLNADGVLDIRYNPAIEYTGIFDPNVCYDYSGTGNTGLYTPVANATRTLDANGKPLRVGQCLTAGTTTAQWSGNWLNYITTSRIDALRRILYGGAREVDSATQTILRRAYIPQDAHTWAKEYTSTAVDGYDIADYTPLGQPTGTGTRRHFFGNLTATAGVNCAVLSDCSNRPPLVSVVVNSNKRVWEWASKERPVLDGSHGGTRTDYTVRAEVCTSSYRSGCKQYGSGANAVWKPIGLLHEYGENGAMLFGLLTGSYNKNTQGGVLRKVASSFADEVNPATGQFTANARIVKTFDSLRIRGFNNARTDNAYKSGWVSNRPMNPGEFSDWGNPLGEMMFEALRYFAGGNAATPTFNTTGGEDAEVGLEVSVWDDPYSATSAAQAPYCAKANILAISDTSPSFDSDEVPGSAFSTFSDTSLAGLDVSARGQTISDAAFETNARGNRFIGQVGNNYDGSPTPKNVTSLGNIRGLSPEEPTRQGSYYSASVAYHGQSTDLRTALQGRQTVDSYMVALSSPLPRIEIPMPNGTTVSLAPFAKSVQGAKGGFQPTNQIVDFYVERFNTSGLYGATFRINFEDVEQGADHDMDAIARYDIDLQSDGTLKIRVTPEYQAGGFKQNMGYVISGTTKDGTYLVVQDENANFNYYLNVPPGRDPGYCDVTSPTPFPADCARLPFLNAPAAGTGVPASPGPFNERIFSAGTSSAGFLKDPLWYAAKWGGFIDRNGNSQPDLRSEWDTDNNGEPDNYFFVQNPNRLKDALRKAFNAIYERSSSAGNITANSTAISTDTLVFQAKFNAADWSGDLEAYGITATSGLSASPVWRASTKTPVASERRIFTFDNRVNVQDTVAFTPSALPSEILTHFGADATERQNVVNFLRGDQSKEIQNGGLLRNRAQPFLGDIVNSSPVYVQALDTVFVNANSGMLHAFNATTGVERFAFIPSASLPTATVPNIRQLADPNYVRRYFLDGEIAVSAKGADTGNRHILVSLRGRGGKGLFALDVTNPDSAGSGLQLWEQFGETDDDMGLMIGRPVIATVRTSTGTATAVIVSNGYNSVSGAAVLYVFNLQTGELIRKLSTGPGADNGLSPPAVKLDVNGVVQYVYAGDLKGNLWKFDLTNDSPTNWASAFLSGSTPVPLFSAVDSSGNPQPITAQPSIAINNLTSDTNSGLPFVFFGTGSYLGVSDPTSLDVQTLYGVIDRGEPVTGRSNMTARTIFEAGTFSGYTVRTFSEAADGDMVGKSGWYLDFIMPPSTKEGERVVSTPRILPRLFRSALAVSTLIPIVDPCVPGGRGYVSLLEPFTGARLTEGLLDLDGAEDFSNDKLNGIFIGSFDPRVGLPGEVLNVGNRLVVGGSDGLDDVKVRLGVVPRVGRISWREIIRD